ncbi:hypothetical protein BCR41DRAFT_364979 [Lobosporangium transversale]|uniref:Male-enhanced antigen 1 n=1 Tax=Lobosporangium transversale TaxID=64571 RepID=A0A1Y2G5V1_9FUNG|nr:hypothetical protein BCR41DRAFT_364979 [Lobosporangium transversale]ORY96040.1 hypothetical protein BCR41DRAFT_364979 [Lobosporangium transversale]|eukprot:XP_021875472.1 hypothetical protein BCR41DRAFT_364979 [Lobosporangium transversale]
MDVDDINARYNEDLVDQLGSSDDGEDPQPFGYIPLNQDNFSDDDDEDEDGEKDGEEHTEYNQMASDDEKDERDKDKRSDDEGEELGYDDYLHSVNSDGTLPIPVIPDAVQIELDKTDERLAEQIPEEDLKTIAMIMSSFTLPAPDWAKAIPEERWLPKIVHQSQIEESSAATTPASDSRS